MKDFNVLILLHKLAIGGQERQFLYLAKYLQSINIPVAVLVSYSGGALYEEYKAAGIEIIDLQKKGRKDMFWFLLRYITAVRQYNPAIIYGAGVVPILFKPFYNKSKIIAAIRSSDMDMSKYHLLYRLHETILQKMMFLTDAVICNSVAGKNFVNRTSKRAKNIFVVGNGFDTDKFKYNESKRLEFRSRFNIEQTTILIGVVARIDPMKDHETFVYAMQRVMHKYSNVKAIIVGDFNNDLGQNIIKLIDTLNLTSQFVFTGHERDLESVYSGLDLLVLPSKTEAFPNVVAEGMLFGLPIVSTRVGDCEAILGKHGWLVPVQNPEMMAEKIGDAIGALGSWNKDLPRQHVIENYSIEKMGSKTYQIFTDIVQR